MPLLKAIDHAMPNGKHHDEDEELEHKRKGVPNPFKMVAGGVGAVAGGVAGGVGAVAGGVGNLTQAAGQAVLGKDAARGAAVHSFDPDATPAEKAAAAGRARGQLAAVPGAGKLRDVKESLTGRAVTIDTSTTESAPAPTVTISDLDRVSRGEGQEVGGGSMPGSIPAGTAPPVPTWLQVGWKQIADAGLGVGQDEKTHQQMSILADYVSENMYGAWYHNAAVIGFAVLTTRLMTVLHFGWGWIIIVLAFCASSYNLSISRTRARARDDIQRELVKTRLVTETESADWLNGFLDRFWLIYEPILSQTIIASVDAVLEANTPAFLESIRLTTFTLGNKAPRIDYVRTFPKTPEDVVIMDWALSFTPNDIEDLTPRQAAARVNPKIVLSIRVGIAGVSKSIPVLLEDMSFTGRMRIKLKLMTNFPHVQMIDLSFIEQPTFDYVLKPIGGETFGMDINQIPGLAPFIRQQVHSNLGPMMYDPNVFTIDLEALLSGTPLDSAIGVLKVHIIDARGLKAVKLGGGAPDPYVSIALGAKPPVSRTKTISNTSNPTFNSTQFILINSLADILNLHLYDYNDHRPDNLLGTVSRELATLNEDSEQQGISGSILGGGKDRGELRYDLAYFPVLQPQKAADGTIEPLPDTSTGIVRLTLHQAKDLDITREHGALNPFAKVYLGGSKTPVHVTPILKKANAPIWESHCEFLVPEKHRSVISLHIIDSKDFAHDPTLGRLTVRLDDLLEAKERQQDWLPLQNSRAGKVRMTAEWKPVAMTGSMDGAAAYVPPIGILRLWLKGAVEVKNVEGTLGGKSDPYVRVMGNNKVLARTEVIDNNLNPQWDQVVYVPIHNPREHIMLEVMDYQNIGKDRSLGHVEIKAGDFLQATDDARYPYASTGPQVRSDRIKLDKANAYKGTLNYEIDFKPAMSLRGGVSFDKQKNDFDVAAEETAGGSGALTPVNENGDAPMTAGSVVTNGTTAPVTNGPRGSISHKPSASLGGTSVVTTQSALSAQESKAGGEATAAENPAKGVVLSDAELVQQPAGVLVFQIISGQLAKRGAVEVMLDDGYWPSFTSTKARSTSATWDQIGEGFVREIKHSKIWLRVNAEPDGEEPVAEFRCDTQDFLRQCLAEPHGVDFLLANEHGQNHCTLKMAARFVPVDIVLEPRERHENMGVMRVDVIGAKNLVGADRSGKSDPYVVFTLNGQKVFKSETKKKTLSPVWDEAFEALVPSRVGATCTFEIFDWDRVGSATPLGSGQIDLAKIELNDTRVLELPVIPPKGGKEGIFQTRIYFQPETRSRMRAGTLTNAGRALGTIGNVPLAAGKGVLHGGGTIVGGVGKGVIAGGGLVVGGVGHVGGFAGRKIGLIKKKDKSGKEVLVPADEEGHAINPAEMAATEELSQGQAYDVPAGQVSQPTELGAMTTGVPGGQTATTLPVGMGAPPSEPGTLSVTVLGAKDLKSKEGNSVKPYVVVKTPGKTYKTGHVKGAEPEWDETFSWTVQPNQSTFHVTIHEHHTLGKDIELGEAEVEIWRDIQPAVPNADVWVELKDGAGLLRLRLDWEAASAGKNGRASNGGESLNRAPTRTESISSKAANGGSPSRFSLGPRTPKKGSKLANE